MAELRELATCDLAAATALLQVAGTFDAAARVAEEKIFGPASGNPWVRSLGAFVGTRLVGLAVVSSRWLRLLAVNPAHRRQGHGSALLAAAENAARAAGESRLRTLDQPGNYLAPGIDAANQQTIEWLQKRGFATKATNHNLLIDVRQNPLVTPAALAARKQTLPAGYEVRAATVADLPTLTAAISATFSAGWAFEVTQATTHPPGVVHIARTSDGDWAAFAAHDGNNRGLGWFGPTGTFPAHRGRGLGAVLLLHCLLDVAAQGLDVCTIAWIGPREFYEKTTGVLAEKPYLVLDKELS